MSGWRPLGPQGNPQDGSGYSGRNRQASNGGLNGVQRSSAAQLREHEALFTTYEHLAGLPRGDSALTLLRKVASLVKPIMRKRGWRVQVLAEFLPPEQNLLGLNINKGYKICIRLRYHNNPDLFLPTEQIVDTMLHELSHNVWGDHDSNFHKLWDELRDEHETLVRKGYSGEGFLGSGSRLGGSGSRVLPPHEMRRLARASAEKRKAQSTLTQGSGQRLGGTPLHQQGRDVRQVIADQVTRRNTINRGCASGRQDAGKLSEQASNNTFKTKAEEDDANNRAIAQALYELMEQEETQKLNGTCQEKTGGGGLEWSAENGLYNAGMSMPSSKSRQKEPSEEDQLRWAMEESTRLASDSSTLQKVTTDGRTQSAPPIPTGSKPPALEEIASTKRKPLEANWSPPPGRSAPIQQQTPVKQRPTDNRTPPTSNVIEITDTPEHTPPPSDQWTCEVCTCINPLQFLSCDACGIVRPQSILQNNREKAKSAPPRKIKTESKSAEERFPIKQPSANASLGWSCGRCGSFMEHKWWTCSACGTMKSSS